MLNILKYLLTISFFLQSLNVFSQNKFSKGYVVTAKGDTINCFVGNVLSGNNPEYVEYKLTNDGQVSKFSIDEAIAFKEELDKYERHNVRLSLSKNAINNLTVGIDTSFTERQVFLKVLHEGKNVNLYVYNDKIKRRFYIKENGSASPIELLMYAYYSDESKTKIVNTKSYNRQWYEVFSHYGLEKQNRDIVMKASYSLSDMLKLAALVNGDNFEVKSKERESIFFVGVGVNRHYLRYVGDHQLAVDAENKVSFSPYFFAGIDWMLAPRIGRSTVRLEFSYYKLKGEVIRRGLHHGPYDMQQLYEQNNVGVSAQYLHKFYKSKAMDVYAGIGALFQYSIKTNGLLMLHYPHISYAAIDQPSQLSQTSIFLPVTLGVTLKRFDLNIGYVSGKASKDYQNYRIKSNRIKLGLAYQFNKK